MSDGFNPWMAGMVVEQVLAQPRFLRGVKMRQGCGEILLVLGAGVLGFEQKLDFGGQMGMPAEERIATSASGRRRPLWRRESQWVSSHSLRKNSSSHGGEAAQVARIWWMGRTVCSPAGQSTQVPPVSVEIAFSRRQVSGGVRLVKSWRSLI